MDVQKKLDEIVATVAGARSLPMSASCVVNRAELLGLLEEVRAALPDSLAQAREVIGGRERMVADAREEAERIIESARAQRGSLISDTEVARESREEADRILAEARREAAEIRAQADDYVDGKLANFEVVLTKTRGSVERGREKLLGLGDGRVFDDPEGLGADVPERSGDPATQRHNADAYVDAKLTAVSAVLAKTLEAVGRGREKLLGARPADELGAHLAAQDGRPAERPATDADFLAELAAHPAPAAATEPARSDWASPQEPVQDAGYGWQPYPGQTDPYAVGGTGGGHTGQEAGYGWPAQDAGQQAYGHGHGHGYGQGYDQGYGQGYPPAPPRQDAPLEGVVVVPPQGGGALDETSFFDTSMIDLEQLRRYEQGR
ncbi:MULTISPECIES: ATP synthase F0 subunit B [Streptomyces]|uniref:ATP synthase F0 subunit B n=1 Tax=Streptomyces TaxID=1883 RepID=UPI00163BEE0A|nr:MULTISPECIES: ATP synthase F0 subunit B [Streptomyces]MBC2874661.1 cell division initiation protein [Streptomyces sp. TYQ1024]UBI41028.1 ATP synthase F0 subunit B [Streptomyces mobaraensis]UKW33513.1 ATP synthase F0 subunit B [Streptomyces sp. TYQ1024]